MLKIISLSVLLLTAGIAMAEPVVASDSPAISDARALLEKGLDNDAVGVLGQLLQHKPGDFQAWFLLGVTQAKQRRFHDAIISFGKVVSLQPKLAEPHNNLAVIYNELGDFRAAVKELEASLKLKPDYATAHENIGDLYVKLAADAYRKALAADGRPALRQRYDRLLHIRDTQKAVRAPSHKPDLAGGKPDEQASAQKRSMPQTVIVDTENKVAAKPEAGESKHPIQPLPATVILQETALKTPVMNADNKGKVAKKPGAPVHAVKSFKPQGDIKSAIAAVEAWRSAWNRQDVPAYFAAYSDAFDFGTRFQTLQQWKQYKQRVITKRTFIRVTLENIEAKKLPNGEIRLVFLQHFRSESFNSDDIKEMLLRQTRDGWKIIYEASR